jgi:hypothetical protein
MLESFDRALTLIIEYTVLEDMTTDRGWGNRSHRVKPDCKYINIRRLSPISCQFSQHHYRKL